MQVGSEIQFSDIRDSGCFRLASNGDMDLTWILAGLEKPGKSKSGLADAMGVSPSAVTALLKGGRQLKAAEVSKVVNYLEIDPPEELLPPADPHAAKPRGKSRTLIEPVLIVGEVAGGVWSEPRLEFKPIPTDVARDTKWPAEALYCLRVRGNSVNRQAKDGDLVLCLDVFAAPRPVRNGDWVIVERQRGGLIETTVKKVAHSYNGEWMLEPDSDDGQFQSSIPLEGTEEETIRVRAFVLDFIRQGTRF